MSTRRELTRRRFLKRATAAAGAGVFPAIVPASARGADGHVAPSNRITMASIGTGGQGRHDTRALMSIPEVQYLAVCDVDVNHRAQAEEMIVDYYTNKNDKPYSALKTYNDFRDVLARDDIDAVMIATPDHWHAVISKMAALAGKDIYCEKPLANSIPEGRAVVDTATRYQRVFQTGSHERSRDNARFAAELVRNGRIGKLHTIRVNQPIDNHGPVDNKPEMPVPDGFDYGMWLGPAPAEPYTEMRCHFYFRYILDYSGGEMTDRGAHIIDLAQLGNGTDRTGPTSVEGTGWFPEDGLFNTAMSYSVRFEYANGVTLYVESKGPRGVKFGGDEGWGFVHVHGGQLEAEPASLLSEVIGPEELRLGRSRGHHIDFVNNIKRRGECKAPPEVGHRSASMCHLANIALKRGKKLQWDPDRERFTNDDEANRMLVPHQRAPWTV